MSDTHIEIDLRKKFQAELCTFEMSKQVREKGMTCANTFLAYDETGELNDGAWLEKVTGQRMYPAVNFTMAVLMLEDVPDSASIECWELSGEYFCTYRDRRFQADNLVDLLLKVWVHCAKK